MCGQGALPETGHSARRRELIRSASPVDAGREATGWPSREWSSVNWQENDFGGREVMTAKDDEGFLVWGSTPRAIDSV